MNTMIVLIAIVAVIILLLVIVAQLEMKLAEQEGCIWALKTKIDYCMEEIAKLEVQNERR